MPYDPVTMCLSSAYSDAILAKAALKAAVETLEVLGGKAAGMLAIETDAARALRGAAGLCETLEGLLTEYSDRSKGARGDGP